MRWPEGGLWQLAHDVALGCLHVDAANATDGLWQLAQSLPKWLDGAEWHAVHRCESGCENAQLTPRCVWQLSHA